MTCGKVDNSGWCTTHLNACDEILETLACLSYNQGKSRWLFRGQPGIYENLDPSLDRGVFKDLNRSQKLSLERQSIELFRSTFKFITDQDEREFLRNDIYSIALLQHSGAPTRFLDWSFSPYIGAYFAVCKEDDKDHHGECGELWCFDESQYEKIASLKWPTIPDVFDKNGQFDGTMPSIFKDEYEANWFVCQFLSTDIRRYVAQDGAFTLTSQFGKNHAAEIKSLLGEGKYFHRYIFAPKEDKHNLKAELRHALRKCNVWHGTLYPDAVGIAEGVKEVLNDEAGKLLTKKV